MPSPRSQQCGTIRYKAILCATRRDFLSRSITAHAIRLPCARLAFAHQPQTIAATRANTASGFRVALRGRMVTPPRSHTQHAHCLHTPFTTRRTTRAQQKKCRPQPFALPRPRRSPALPRIPPHSVTTTNIYRMRERTEHPRANDSPLQPCTNTDSQPLYLPRRAPHDSRTGRRPPVTTTANHAAPTAIHRRSDNPHPPRTRNPIVRTLPGHAHKPDGTLETGGSRTCKSRPAH